MYKGQLEGFPKEVVDKMLYYQVQQGNKEDITVFEKHKDNNCSNKGFDWDKTPESKNFWYEVIQEKNFDLFFQKYPKNTYPKVMWVSMDAENWKKRVVFMEKNNKYIAWSDIDTLEKAEKITEAYGWLYAKDIEESKIVEVTLEDVAKAMNVSPELLRIKK